jgi:hypothetical protein
MDAARPAYDAAYDALLRGELTVAQAGFHDVATRAIDPDLAIRARELARLVDQMVAGKLRIVADGAPHAASGSKEHEEIVKDDEDDGRTSVIVLSTIMGLYGGSILVADANVEDFRAGIALITATTAAGLLLSYKATDGQGITGAQSDAYALGLVEGLANGGLLAHPIGLGDDGQHLATTMFVSGVAGAFIGLGYARAVHPTRGQIGFAGSLSMLGAASVGLGLGIAQPSTSNGDAILVSIAAGTDAGLALGLGLGRNLDWSVSRARLVQLGILVGGLAGLATGALITGTDTDGDTAARTLSATSLAGIWGGFALAATLTRDMRVDRSFRNDATTTMLAPMAVRGGGGVSLVGQF